MGRNDQVGSPSLADRAARARAGAARIGALTELDAVITVQVAIAQNWIVPRGERGRR